MHRPRRLFQPAAWLLALGCLAAAPLQATVPGASGGEGVAWLSAAADADVERAFAQARGEGKPLLLYWGAKWCPPCNQLKATLFNRQDFVERSRAFVAVNLDGDLPGAQKLGTRFKVRGYPTMILFNPQGQEITRLPGEVDAPQVMQVLQLGLAGGRSVKSVLEDARAGRALAPNEWRLLAFYGWDTDESQLVSAAERPGLLAQLAARCPPAESAARTRLLFKALAASDEGRGLKPDAAARQRVAAVLADAKAARALMDVLTNFATEVTTALAPSPGAERTRLAAQMDTALQRLQADATLSRADRMGALLARVELARLGQPKDSLAPKIPPALVVQVRAAAAQADREISDGYERQAVITTAGHLLGQAGLWDDSDALLKASLARSHSPYYLMSQLAGNARKRGRAAEALDWYQKAFDGSEGPATRLQWGAAYLGALVDLSPADAARIEKAAQQLIALAAQDRSAFYERSERSLQRVGSKLKAWNKGGAQDAVLQRLGTQMQAVCDKLDSADPQRAGCERVFGGAAKAG